nr:hypothetical protein KPHV_41660 [Kitasatospora purpeofusca]
MIRGIFWILTAGAGDGGHPPVRGDRRRGRPPGVTAGRSHADELAKENHPVGVRTLLQS